MNPVASVTLSVGGREVRAIGALLRTIDEDHEVRALLRERLDNVSGCDAGALESAIGQLTHFLRRSNAALAEEVVR